MRVFPPGWAGRFSLFIVGRLFAYPPKQITVTADLCLKDVRLALALMIGSICLIRIRISRTLSQACLQGKDYNIPLAKPMLQKAKHFS